MRGELSGSGPHIVSCWAEIADPENLCSNGYAGPCSAVLSVAAYRCPYPVLGSQSALGFMDVQNAMLSDNYVGVVNLMNCGK